MEIKYRNLFKEEILIKYDKIDREIKLDFKDVLIKPKPSSTPITRADVNLNVNYGHFTGVPLIISEMVSIGTYKIAKALKDQNIITFIHKEYSSKEHIENLSYFEDTSHIGLSVGIKKNEISKIKSVLKERSVGFINLHIANAYANLQGIEKTIKSFKDDFPDIPLSAGMVCTPNITKFIAECGADIIRVGLGSGAACKTRSEVGVGFPQLSAVKECKNMADIYKKPIISDGGIVTAGDVAKAIGIGASYVVLGRIVSGSEECDNIVEKYGQKYVNFYGLGSTRQYETHGISEKEYRPNEGRELFIPVKGSVNNIINQIKGGLRSACTYVGTTELSELYNNSSFIRVNNQINETMSHYEKIQ